MIVNKVSGNGGHCQDSSLSWFMVKVFYCDSFPARPWFDLPHHEVHIVLRRISALGDWVIVEPAHLAQGLPDPDDAPFVECARARGCRWVTGDKRHFPRKVVRDLRVVSPREFVMPTD